MTSKEFVEICISAGYADEDKAKSYISLFQKDEYTDDDFISVYRINTPAHSRRPCSKVYRIDTEGSPDSYI